MMCQTVNWYSYLNPLIVHSVQFVVVADDDIVHAARHTVVGQQLANYNNVVPHVKHLHADVNVLAVNRVSSFVVVVVSVAVVAFGFESNTWLALVTYYQTGYVVSD